MNKKIAKKHLSSLEYQLRRLEDSHSEHSETCWSCIHNIRENFKKEDLAEMKIHLRWMLILISNFSFNVQSMIGAIDYITSGQAAADEGDY